jgi:hypothetical protein
MLSFSLQSTFETIKIQYGSCNCSNTGVGNSIHLAHFSYLLSDVLDEILDDGSFLARLFQVVIKIGMFVSAYKQPSGLQSFAAIIKS